MYRRPNLSFFLALSLACVLAVFLEFDGDWALDETPAVAQATDARAPVRVVPVEIADAPDGTNEISLADQPAPTVGGQTLEH